MMPCEVGQPVGAVAFPPELDIYFIPGTEPLAWWDSIQNNGRNGKLNSSILHYGAAFQKCQKNRPCCYRICHPPRGEKTDNSNQSPCQEKRHFSPNSGFNDRLDRLRLTSLPVFEA